MYKCCICNRCNIEQNFVCHNGQSHSLCLNCQHQITRVENICVLCSEETKVNNDVPNIKISKWRFIYMFILSVIYK